MDQLHVDASFRGQPPCEEMEELHLDAKAAASTSSSSPSPFWARRIPEWGLVFYIRVDRAGSFHTYPDDVGGPFQSLKGAGDAIDHNLRARRVEKMCMEKSGISVIDRAIREYLFWPDGTRRRRSQSERVERTHKASHRFAQALVDNYNEDHNLLGDAAYELKDVVHHIVIFENPRMYYHFNFTLKTKGADGFDRGGGIDNLFFAEVKCTRQGENTEIVASCFCMLKPTDNGHCYGCTNNGAVGMKHPNEASAYIGGHLDVQLPFHRREWSDDTEDELSAVKRIRHFYKVTNDCFSCSTLVRDINVVLRKSRRRTISGVMLRMFKKNHLRCKIKDAWNNGRVRRTPARVKVSAAANFKSLMSITLSHMTYCTRLPDGLCRILCLEELHIDDAPAIKFVGPDFQALASGDGGAIFTRSFPKLRELNLLGLSGWKNWDWEEQQDKGIAMPALEHLGIIDCKLRCLPPGLASNNRYNLRTLYLKNLVVLTCVENFPSVVEFDALYCPKLKRISGLSNLRTVYIDGCPKLKLLEGIPVLDSMVLDGEPWEVTGAPAKCTPKGYLAGQPRHLPQNLTVTR